MIRHSNILTKHGGVLVRSQTHRLPTISTRRCLHSKLRCRAQLETRRRRQQQQQQQQLQQQQQQQEQQVQEGLLASTDQASSQLTPSQLSQTLPSWVSHPAALATCLALFSLISIDVFVPWSLHALPLLDDAIHRAVVLNIDPQLRALSDWTVSDVFIVGGILGWLVCSVAAVLNRGPLRAALPLGGAWLFYFVGFGAVTTDTPLVASLKHGFGRIRPSTLHHTFSFPSGHTTAAVFIVGALLLVLLPLATRPQQASNSTSVDAGWQLPDSAVLAVWATAGVTTAAGRVLADVHWLSDTLAGAALATGGVSALAWAVRKVDSSTGRE